MSFLKKFLTLAGLLWNMLLHFWRMFPELVHSFQLLLTSITQWWKSSDTEENSDQLLFDAIDLFNLMLDILKLDPKAGALIPTESRVGAFNLRQSHFKNYDRADILYWMLCSIQGIFYNNYDDSQIHQMRESISSLENRLSARITVATQPDPPQGGPNG
jgi:hypothetical protein